MLEHLLYRITEIDEREEDVEYEDIIEPLAFFCLP